MTIRRFKSPDGTAMRRLYTWISGKENDITSSSYTAEVVVQITSAQILALFATPIEVIPAPGAGKYIEIESVTAWLDYNSAAYAGIAAGEDWVLKEENAAGAEITGHLETTGFLDQTSDQVRNVRGLIVSRTPVANKAIVLHQLVAEIITGDSPVNLAIVYRVRAANPVVPA